jgi:hypothetical protein
MIGTIERTNGGRSDFSAALRTRREMVAHLHVIAREILSYLIVYNATVENQRNAAIPLGTARHNVS